MIPSWLKCCAAQMQAKDKFPERNSPDCATELFTTTLVRTFENIREIIQHDLPEIEKQVRALQS